MTDKVILAETNLKFVVAVGADDDINTKLHDATTIIGGLINGAGYNVCKNVEGAALIDYTIHTGTGEEQEEDDFPFADIGAVEIKGEALEKLKERVINGFTDLPTEDAEFVPVGGGDGENSTPDTANSCCCPEEGGSCEDCTACPYKPEKVDEQ